MKIKSVLRWAGRIILFLVVCLGVGVALFYGIENWRGHRAWQTYLATARAQGQWTSPADFVLPPVAADLNFAETAWLESAAYKNKTAPAIMAKLEGVLADVDSEAMGDFQKGTWTCFDCAADGSLTVSAEAIQGARQVLAACQPLTAEIDELHRAARRPFARFKLGDIPFRDVPNFVFLRNLTKILSCRALAELTLGEVGAAFSDLEVIHKIAEGLREQPTLVAAMIRCAILDTLEKQPFYEGWARRQWTEGQYQQLQEYFAGAHCLQSVERSMRGGERLGVEDLVVKRSAKELQEVFSFALTRDDSGSLEARAKQLGLRCMPRGWWLRGLVVHHQILDQALAAAYDPLRFRVNAAACDRSGAQVEQAIAAARPFHFLAAAAIPNMGRAFKRAAAIETINNQAILICALERFHFRHGSYPATLSELVPAFAPSLPKDPISGQVALYERQADGTFLLFSQGWARQSEDEEDPPSQPDPDDFVWPFRRSLPSSPAH